MESVALRLPLHDLRIAGALMLAAGVARGVAHSNLGVPCPLRALTGVPCPLCGMTTSVTEVTTGHLGAAIAANPGGLIAVVVALALLATPRATSIDLPRWLLPASLAAMWVWQLFRFHVA